MHLSEIIDIVIWVRGFSDKEIAVKQGNLVELVLVNSIIDDHLGVPTLCRHKSLALYRVDVFVGSGRGGFGVVFDVEVFLVVDFLELVLVHVVVVGAGSVAIAVVSAGEEWVVASERSGSGNGAFEERRWWWWGVEEEGGVWGGECGEFVWW